MGFSRYYLCDLQVHTPADKGQGYGDAGGREPNREFAQRLVEAHAAAGVRVLAVADHNRVDWYPLLREEGEKVGVYVFPAVEFSVNRCHLIAIWDRTDDGFSLAKRFLATLWEPGELAFETNGDPRPVSSGQVRDVAKAAVAHRALVIAPHSTLSQNGFFASGVCSNRAAVLGDGTIAAFDVWGNKRADVLATPSAEFGDRKPSWILTGDVRKFADIGKRAVYLKLGPIPTLEGLRQAFLMPETRIRFPTSVSSAVEMVAGARVVDSVEPRCPRLEKLSIKGGFHDGLELPFGPGLNAVIGGKGTGKSTLVEIIRHALHAGAPYGESAGNRERNFRANAEVSIWAVDANGDQYEVRRSGSGDPARLLRSGQDVAVEVARRLPIRVFGQRELQALAERDDLLREFVASEASHSWTEAVAEEKRITGALADIGVELRGLEEQIARLDDDERELADVDDQIANATARGAGELITELDALATIDHAMKEVLGWPDEVAQSLTGIVGLLPPPHVPAEAKDQEPLRESSAGLADQLQAAVAALSPVQQRASQEAVAGREVWAKQRDARRSEIERKLADAGINDPRDLGRHQARAQELRALLAELPAKRGRCDELADRRTRHLQELADIRREKSRLIESSAKSLNARVGTRVRIQVDPLSDRGPLLRTLEEAVRGQGVRADQLRRLSETRTPSALATAIRSGPPAVELLGCSAATASKLCGLGPHTVRALEETAAPDRIVVEVDLASDAQTPAWTDVADVSPGQKATALLALALAGGSEPLIIDQPEDDLDNRYIYDEVVQVLSRVCETRQVIVATHNANIPVLGDAEMLIALDAKASKGSVLACGGLEDGEVATWARKILEGGEVAFQARHDRYRGSTS